MKIRRYQPGDEVELAELFLGTVREVNRKDYSSEQIRAWAPESFDRERWRVRMQNIQPFVCIDGDQIVGFADLQDSGYIDMFYVHHQWQRRGVGTRLFDAIDQDAKARRLTELTSHVSITARPFFESRGFQVVTAQEVQLGNVSLTNFKMSKQLRAE